ncbi:hydroxyphenylacetyl-CoA thioesterase PaaI [Pedomonas mirosovicensis]|uniref:hydroxyphenylacetyl-CoA thioesterase PaaI n=1 Tax=Pedomonas mirosovicensis TaxID=2908641 RepID=UPI0021687DA0|nr:hydroxyphenylacetyl-CoA thioesterase PaaI [Pedomonas mirosovicensis]MCH8684517.1 hydroxyphenylacetyl-CoA thioesterase PaaI [Pedomonas mirosovicensis]
MPETEADRLAQRVAARMFSEDKASRGLGMTIDAAGDGWARVSMTVREDMLNGHGTCHGGFMFVLADSAFAFACNSGNQRTVAQHCSIAFLKPVSAGDRLTAEARRQAASGRSGVYDAILTDQDGAVVATFRGLSRRINGEIIEDASEPAPSRGALVE